MKLFDLGVDSHGQKAETIKPLAWPVNAWACFVPEELNPPLNIFEKLILSLIDKNIVSTRSDIKYILTREIGLDENLVGNIVDECCDKHTHRRKEKLQIKVDSLKHLQNMENGISLDAEPSEKMKKIYLFEDLITNTVIPCFNIEKLPEEFEGQDLEEDNYISLQYEKKYSQPRTSSISNALYYWTRIQKEKRNNENPSNNQVKLDVTPIDVNDDVESMLYGFESSENVAEKAQKQLNLKWLTIFDDEPTPLIAKGYVVFNTSNPNSIEVLSPFGSDFDNWFMKIVNRFRITNDDFSCALQLFVEEKAELLKDKIAFNNELDTQLFKEFPVICNDEKYSILKDAIQDLDRSYGRIMKGEDYEIRNFFRNLRPAIESLFTEAIKANPDIYRVRYDYCDSSFGYRNYKTHLSQLVSGYRLNEEIFRRFSYKKIWENMTDSYGKIDKGNSKDNLALILLYANKYPKSSVMDFVKEYQDIFVDVCETVTLCNNIVHPNYMHKHSVQDIEQYYAQYENFVRAIYSHLMEGANNG